MSAFKILADVGGTHVRLGLMDHAGVLYTPLKYRAADFAGFHEAVMAHCDQQGVRGVDIHEALIAARYLDRPWSLEVEDLLPHGLNILGLVGDFEASAAAAPYLPADSLLEIRRGVDRPGYPRVILGPGTGLGLSYLLPEVGGAWRVQQTHGGHMLAALLTDEHKALAKLIAKARNTDTVIYEDFACGRGLLPLYRAVCQMLGAAEQVVDNTEAILDLAADSTVQTTLRIFHEMLGVFAHASVLTLNATGGVYLDGGMIQRLRERDLFDADCVLRFMTLNPVPVLKQELDTTPVWIVNDPYVALRGLAAMYKANRFSSR